MKSYCVYCKSGSEKKLVLLITKSVKELLEQRIEVLFPVRVMNQKKGGKWQKVSQPLIPGYIFLYLDDETPFPLFLIKNERNAYKILRNSDFTLALRGSDEQYAQWVYNHQGKIKPSRVLFKEGKIIKVVDGPLSDLQGKIVKVDRHHKRVHVQFNFGGQERIINLAIDDVEDTED